MKTTDPVCGTTTKAFVDIQGNKLDSVCYSLFLISTLPSWDNLEILSFLTGK